MMTHAERRARRAAMAAKYATGDRTLADIAAEYGVTRGTVWHACREHNVPMPRPNWRALAKPMPHEQGERNAEIVTRYVAGETMKAIADSLGITRQRVSQVIQQLARKQAA